MTEVSVKTEISESLQKNSFFTTCSKIWFNLTLICCTLPPVILAYGVMGFQYFFPFGHPHVLVVEGIYKMFLRNCWLTFRILNPQISITYDKDFAKQIKEMTKPTDKPRMLIINHVSFLDAIYVTSVLPNSVMFSVRTLASIGIMRLPAIGTICYAAGHIVVYFKGATTGISKSDDFVVDPTKVQKMGEYVQTHIHNRGYFILCPEGKLNAVDERKLQNFRYGGFKTIEEHDMKVYGMAWTGFGTVWPVGSIGGTPSKAQCKLFPVFPDGAKEAVKKIEEDKPGSTVKIDPKAEKPESNCKILAETAQEIFQGHLDSLWGKKSD